MNTDMLPPCPPQFDIGAYVLPALQPPDAPAWYTYLSDPEVTRLTSYNIRSVEHVAAMIDEYIAGYVVRRSLRWTLALKSSGVLIGTCGSCGWNPQHAVAELGYDLARAWWGRGVMMKAVRATVHWTFTFLGVNRIQATVMVGNTASARILEKTGFQREGTLREYKICGGQPSDFWMFGQVQKEYFASKKASEIPS
jgi:RimJ/RimL family protein N-acetyltransferase